MARRPVEKKDQWALSIPPAKKPEEVHKVLLSLLFAAAKYPVPRTRVDSTPERALRVLSGDENFCLLAGQRPCRPKWWKPTEDRRIENEQDGRRILCFEPLQTANKAPFFWPR